MYDPTADDRTVRIRNTHYYWVWLKLRCGPSRIVLTSEGGLALGVVTRREKFEIQLTELVANSRRAIN